jgi:hypothetical protein
MQLDALKRIRSLRIERESENRREETEDGW